MDRSLIKRGKKNQDIRGGKYITLTILDCLLYLTINMSLVLTPFCGCLTLWADTRLCTWRLTFLVCTCVVASRKPTVTVRTGIGFVFCMFGANMASKSRLLCECLLALWTFVGSLPRVQTLVLLEMDFLPEPLWTPCTGKGPFISMRTHMAREISLCCKPSPALGANFFPFAFALIISDANKSHSTRAYSLQWWH